MKIVFRAADESERAVEVFGGLTLMEAALRGGIDQIEAECGGACSCATCHVHIPDDWAARTGVASEMEKELLDMVAHRNARSRLSCQINLNESMDGMVVDLPPTDH